MVYKFGSYSISNWITDQDTSVTLLERGTERHPGHAIPGGDGITPRDVEDACLKQEENWILTTEVNNMHVHY